MTGTKECNKCGKKNLGWDYDFNKKTKKWKLENHKRQDGKWCNKPPEIKFTLQKAVDIIKCPSCKGNYGWLLTDMARERHPEWNSLTMEEHTKRFHPNGEIIVTENIKVGQHYTNVI